MGGLGLGLGVSPGPGSVLEARSSRFRGGGTGTGVDGEPLGTWIWGYPAFGVSHHLGPRPLKN